MAMEKKFVIQLRCINQRSNYFIEPIKDGYARLICSICHEILLDPSQTECGCRFCYSCISEYFCRNEKICPGCQTEIPINIVRDRAVEREILNLEIQCLNDGCNHVGLLKYLDDHLDICKWRLKICEICQQSYPYYMEEKHLQEFCINAICKCNNCGMEMTRNEFQTIHVNLNDDNVNKLCTNLIGECPYKCGTELHNLRNHLTDCPNKLKKCILWHLGCQYIDNQYNLLNHMKDEVMSHMSMIINEMDTLKTENINIKQLMIENNNTYIRQIKQLKEENSDLKRQVEDLQSNSGGNRVAIDNIKTKIDCYKHLIDGDNNNRDLYVVNGVCIWTIRNIRQKIEYAKLGIDIQIISNPFYLYRPGYRFCLKIYPNGDNQGKDNFLSIYFVILKGEFDDEISWPFRQKVSLSLMSNDRMVQNISIHMKPDENTTCYGKPLSDFNLGAGQPEFLNLSKLIDNNNYIRDGSIRIRFEMKSENYFAHHENLVLENIRKIK